mmetsp:Transcript_17399/g.41595  ORF Transcript_17399/g.41595 Transcript_17399/m.41595 type:complete len:250 (+) Transcript_17399:324-1073(+)
MSDTEALCLDCSPSKPVTALRFSSSLSAPDSSHQKFLLWMLVLWLTADKSVAHLGPTEPPVQQISGRRLQQTQNTIEPLLVSGFTAEPNSGHTYLLKGVGGSFAASFHTDSMIAYSQQVHSEIFDEKIEIVYHGLSSGKARCRFQDYDSECSPDDDFEPKQGLAFAGSDSPYTVEYHQKYPTHEVFPVAASAVVVGYNLPGLGSEGLSLSLETIAKIFTGNITRWNDAEIMELNKNKSFALPDMPISVH